MDDRERIAELERQLAARSKPAANGFTGGFFGCFGVLAAVIVVIVGIAALGQCATTADQARIESTGPVGRDYLTHCAAAVVAADDDYRLARGAEYEVGTDPTIVRPGPPPEVSCPYVDRNGRPIEIRMVVICDAVLDHSCRNILAVNGR